MRELDALRAVDFDWAVHLKNVWSDPPCDVPSLHAEPRSDLVRELEYLNASQNVLSPLGRTIVGSGGTGKTHLLSFLRHEAISRRIAFVLVDMTDVHDFWGTVLLGYLSSLQQSLAEGRFQYQLLLERFIDSMTPGEPGRRIVEQLRHARTDRLPEGVKVMLSYLGKRHPAETMTHQNVIRALICLNSADFDVASTGLTWLQGYPIDDQQRIALGFSQASQQPIEIVRGVSWLMSLAGPAVVALDQLDPIVAQMQIASGRASAGLSADRSWNEEIRVAKTIIENIAAGLRAVRDVTLRTLVVVSCLETTWAMLKEVTTVKSNLDTYKPPLVLANINSRDAAEGILRARLAEAYRKTGFRPPYPAWPFAPRAFDAVHGVTPREILKIGYQWQQMFLSAGKITEVTRLAPPEVVDGPTQDYRELDLKFQRYRAEADLAAILAEETEDEQLASMLQSACKCLVKEARLPEGVQAVVDVDFHGGKTTRPLHARIRLIHTHESEREEHFCLRALERQHPLAFQARLKAAMTLSGIDTRLHFRHLALARRNPLPTGKVTRELISQFENSGGAFVSPRDDELRSLWALYKMDGENPLAFVPWLRARRPASQLPLMQRAAGPLCGTAGETAPQTPIETAVVKPVPVAPPADKTDAQDLPKPRATVSTRQPRVGVSNAAPPVDGQLMLGWSILNDKPIRPVTMPVSLLNKHTVILAGAGSGKTVLVRRLVEEAALLGIPSIVIDGANDLATLGDPWPQPHPAWLDGDAEKAHNYFAGSETIVWTPKLEAGNPLVLAPLPDLSVVADDADELTQAIEMASDAVEKIAITGGGAKANLKRGILVSALRFLAKNGGGGLPDLMGLLADLPPAAGPGVDKQQKMAAEMADQIKSAIQVNPLLCGSGTPLDPAVLFGDARPSEKVRVSVINFAGLQGIESQRQFLNQLAMTLFSWIKKNPNPAGRVLRGLLVLDEAKDFVPSVGQTACKGSLMRLAAQARKYRLGVVFATQNPKEIENTIIGNCSTNFFGKANSPEAIDVVQEQIKLRGGSGHDIPALAKGTFYVYNADARMQAPEKVRIPMCLSRHGPGPLEAKEIVERAQKSKERLGL